MSFWDRLQELMRIHKISQSDMQKILDVSHSYLTVSIKREAMPGSDVLMKTADFFNVSPRWLMTGEDDKPFDAKYSVVIDNKQVMEIGYLLTKCDSDYIDLIGELVEHEISHKTSFWH